MSRRNLCGARGAPGRKSGGEVRPNRQRLIVCMDFMNLSTIQYTWWILNTRVCQITFLIGALKYTLEHEKRIDCCAYVEIMVFFERTALLESSQLNIGVSVALSLGAFQSLSCLVYCLSECCGTVWVCVGVCVGLFLLLCFPLIEVSLAFVVKLVWWCWILLAFACLKRLDRKSVV